MQLTEDKTPFLTAYHYCAENAQAVEIFPCGDQVFRLFRFYYQNA